MKLRDWRRACLRMERVAQKVMQRTRSTAHSWDDDKLSVRVQRNLLGVYSSLVSGTTKKRRHGIM